MAVATLTAWSKDAAGRTAFYAPTQLTERIAATPEGYLLCRDVVIGRTGNQDYTPDEVPVDDGGEGVVHVDRPASEVFDENTIQSFEGKPVTIGHPDDFVTPKNWKQATVGTTQNVRRGTGSESDYLMADLLITDEQAIVLVQNGLREISCGYEADYVQDAPGRAHQTGIFGNHVALVDRGRCGGACSIRDQERSMSAWDKLLAACGVKSGDELKDKLNDEDTTVTDKAGDKPKTKDCGCGTQGEGAAKTGDADGIQAVLDKLGSIDERLNALEQGGEPAKSADGDGAAKTGDDASAQGAAKTGDEPKGGDQGGDQGGTKDTANTQDAKTIIPQAEILAPGFRVADNDTVASAQRRALDKALEGPHGDAVKGFLNDRTPDKISDAELPSTFSAAAQMVRQLNNSAGMRSAISKDDFGQPATVADINKANAAYWNK